MLNLYDVCVNILINSGYVIFTGIWEKCSQFLHEYIMLPLYKMVTGIIGEGGKE
jgi:hypothetical protein